MKSETIRAIIIFTCICAILFPHPASAEKVTCAVYFTGIGCPHCAKTDPFLLERMTSEHPELIIIEYEIYRTSGNARLMYEYDTNYKSGFGIPLLIFGKDSKIAGDIPIIDTFEGTLQENRGNPCPLLDGTSEDFENLRITSLPGKPKIWRDGRVLLHSESTTDDELLRELILGDMEEVLKGREYKIVEPSPVPLSGKEVNFENAVEVEGWVVQWNGEPVKEKEVNETGRVKEETNDTDENTSELTVAKILSLAAVDAVNPCAIAVLTLMLIAIMTYNPEKRRNILLAGFAFITSVYIIYLLYGLVIIRFFQVVQTLTSVRLVLYHILGVFAMKLGAFNIKDFIKYRPGGILTEMPMSMRPRVKKIIEGIVSPKGAFLVGTFVTIFLLPCTIGPYVIAGGILSVLELFQTIPWLLVYNLVFVSPMILITLLVYAGFTTVENVSGWKERNIRYLHLIAGIIMFLLGLAMFFGLV